MALPRYCNILSTGADKLEQTGKTQLSEPVSYLMSNSQVLLNPTALRKAKISKNCPLKDNF